MRAIITAFVLGLSMVATPPATASIADCSNGYVALTFDDGPVRGRTERVLDILDRWDAKATFFVNGRRVLSAPEVTRRIADEGHMVANHGFAHAWLTRLSDDGIRSELGRAISAAASVGVEMAPIVRPPYGAANSRVRAVFARLGLAEVRWTVDPWDWRGHSAGYLTNHVLDRLAPGAIVLFHDGSPKSRVVGALDGILWGMSRRGYCPGVFDAAGRVVPAFDPVSLPYDPGPSCPDGRSCDTIGVVAAGHWTVGERPATDASTRSFWFGAAGDLPLSGDWDGDGDDDPGAYRPSTTQVHLRRGDGSVRVFGLGNPGDVPLAGDWDGDGKDTISLYRPSNQTFYVFDTHGGRAGGSFVFGNPGDQPFSGDLDADGRDEVGLHRATTGRVYYRTTLDSGAAHHDFVFGDPGDVLLAGDWNGDGQDTMAVYRPSQGVWYLKLRNGSGVADHVVWLSRHGPVAPVVIGRS